MGVGVDEGEPSPGRPTSGVVRRRGDLTSEFFTSHSGEFQLVNRNTGFRRSRSGRRRARRRTGPSGHTGEFSPAPAQFLYPTAPASSGVSAISSGHQHQSAGPFPPGSRGAAPFAGHPTAAAAAPHQPPSLFSSGAPDLLFSGPFASFSGPLSGDHHLAPPPVPVTSSGSLPSLAHTQSGGGSSEMLLASNQWFSRDAGDRAASPMSSFFTGSPVPGGVGDARMAGAAAGDEALPPVDDEDMGVNLKSSNTILSGLLSSLDGNESDQPHDTSSRYAAATASSMMQGNDDEEEEEGRANVRANGFSDAHDDNGNDDNVEENEDQDEDDQDDDSDWSGAVARGGGNKTSKKKQQQQQQQRKGPTSAKSASSSSSSKTKVNPALSQAQRALQLAQQAREADLNSYSAAAVAAAAAASAIASKPVTSTRPAGGGLVDLYKPRSRRPQKTKPRKRQDEPRSCSECEATDTIQWRRDVDGNILCNKCGLRALRRERSEGKRRGSRKKTPVAPPKKGAAGSTSTAAAQSAAAAAAAAAATAAVAAAATAAVNSGGHHHHHHHHHPHHEHHQHQTSPFHSQRAAAARAQQQMSVQQDQQQDRVADIHRRQQLMQQQRSTTAAAQAATAALAAANAQLPAVATSMKHDQMGFSSALLPLLHLERLNMTPLLVVALSSPGQLSLPDVYGGRVPAIGAAISFNMVLLSAPLRTQLLQSGVSLDTIVNVQDVQVNEKGGNENDHCV